MNKKAIAQVKIQTKAQAKEILGGLCISGMMFMLNIFFWCCI